jgi:hypothetical protein
MNKFFILGFLFVAMTDGSVVMFGADCSGESARAQQALSSALVPVAASRVRALGARRPMQAGSGINLLMAGSGLMPQAYDAAAVVQNVEVFGEDAELIARSFVHHNIAAGIVSAHNTVGFAQYEQVKGAVIAKMAEALRANKPELADEASVLFAESIWNKMTVVEARHDDEQSKLTSLVKRDRRKEARESVEAAIKEKGLIALVDNDNDKVQLDRQRIEELEMRRLFVEKKLHRVILQVFGH